MQSSISYLKGVIVAGVLFIGLSSVFAVWNPPTATPPNGNTPAPINTSPATQIKTGSLAVGPLVVNGQIVINGGSPSAGKVLTAVDDTGKAEWGDLSSTGGRQVKTGSYKWTDGTTKNYPQVCGVGAPVDAWGRYSPGWDNRTLSFHSFYTYTPSYPAGIAHEFVNGQLSTVFLGDTLAVYYVSAGDNYTCTYNITNGRWVGLSKCTVPGHGVPRIFGGFDC